MNTNEFLNWIADRIVYAYGEDGRTDFVQKLRRMAAEHEEAAVPYIQAKSQAVRSLTRMANAFGSGVQASDPDKARALADAYACIEADLRSTPDQKPAREWTKHDSAVSLTEFLSEHVEKEVSVYLANAQQVNGSLRYTIDDDDRRRWFIFRPAVPALPLELSSVERVTCEK